MKRTMLILMASFSISLALMLILRKRYEARISPPIQQEVIETAPTAIPTSFDAMVATNRPAPTRFILEDLTDPDSWRHYFKIYQCDNGAFELWVMDNKRDVFASREEAVRTREDIIRQCTTAAEAVNANKELTLPEQPCGKLVE